MIAERQLDVSDLEPPEPLVRTLAAAERLEAGDFLRMRHRRHPNLLYDNLTERGFDSLTRQCAGGGVEVYIWRLDDSAAEAAARAAFEQGPS